MATASVNGTVVAQSDTTEIVEGNHYFPPESISWEYFTKTDTATVCPWKGSASYYTLQVGDQTLSDAAWTYHQPSDAAANIRDHVAFYSAVTVSTD